MKILAIRGKNLASIEGEFEIDFRKEPLCSAGIFAITGPTGSGKSTILDAMCIALYSYTPRLKSITSINTIETHGETDIKENNIGTILRKGKIEGYAEVDFKAIDGNEYRTRWNIRRANNRPEGNLKSATYDVTNLTTGEHIPLGISEHRPLMIRLTGLTFEQFTRAVLLAQGSFAAFLKANENDKATILQALTGTEIYKKISEIIYRRNDEAKKELALIEEKKQELVILTDDELATLNENKNIQLKNQERINKEQQTYVTKKNWLERMIQLAEMFENAEKSSAAAKLAFDEAAPRIEQLQLIDSVLDIRDKYTSLCNSEASYNNCIKEISKIEVDCVKWEAEWTKATNKATSTKIYKEEVEKKWLDIQPRITQAIKLEEQKENEIKREKEISKEKETLQKEYQECTIKTNNIAKRIEILKEEQQKISHWFVQHRCYENAIPYIPSIITNITSAKNDTIIANSKAKQLAQAEEMLGTNIKRLETTLKRKEELEHTLSSEIAALREKLVEGMPCPVCGSRHHEISHDVMNILEEKELQKVKEEVKQQQEYLESAVESGKREIVELKATIEMRRSSAREMMSTCIDFMHGIENAEELLLKEDISALLNDIKTKWDENTESRARKKEEESIQTNALELLEKQSFNLVENISTKKRLLEEREIRIKNIKSEIEAIIGCYTSVKALQEQYQKQKREAEAAATTASDNLAYVVGIYNKLKGQLAEKKRALDKESENIALLQKEIENYLALRGDNLTFQRLKDIFSIDQVSVATLRNNIETLKNAVATTAATTAERKRHIEEHKKADVKPSENENMETLQLALNELTEKNKEIIEELARINAALQRHNDNCQKFAEYKDEYDKKLQYAQDIGILNASFGSASGNVLTKYVQGYTLDILLNVANTHLKDITGRYELTRISNESLGIKIIDLDMMSETRSVHTLSGGETFLVSLALSLALSSISSNKMSIESLFIDEGFGALDSDTLKTVMSALERLQSQGRTIGVISHYGEMLEQIPVKIAVIKKNAGRSKIEIKEN